MSSDGLGMLVVGLGLPAGALAAVVIGLVGRLGGAPAWESASPSGDGAAIYANQCAGCHGASGQGDGIIAPSLSVLPRDFTTEPLRYAATGGTQEETARAIRRIVAEGQGIAMPAFGQTLAPGEIAAVSEHVLTLATATPLLAESDALRIQTRPWFTDVLRSRGKKLYQSFMCWSCHGEMGEGDGEGAQELYDFRGREMRPANLREGMLKSGSSRAALYRVLAMGVPGTPMQGYRPMLVRRGEDGSIDDGDIWALVAFIESLRE